MQNPIKKKRICFLMGSFLVIFFNTSCFSKTIIINKITIIDKPTTYKNVILNINHGYFVIINQAALKIKNSIINGSVSPNNNSLIKIIEGKLILKNNKFNITAVNIQPHPSERNNYDVINIEQGKLKIVGNNFNIDLPFTVSLLVSSSYRTSNFYIKDNIIRNFHGAIFLKNSHDAIVSNNVFANVSISNIFTQEGNNNVFEKNTMLFPGNNNIGDGIDVIDSYNITLKNNLIFSGSCYSIIILRSNRILIDNNKIIGGITYAILIKTLIGLKDLHGQHLLKLMGSEQTSSGAINKDIRITNNYLSQNRYGLTAANVDGLIVENNIFIQRFLSNAARKFWTDNHVLFQGVSNIVWRHNLYKEAFSQDPIDDGNHNSFKFVVFPLYGGVDL